MSRFSHNNSRSAPSSDDELLQVVEQHLQSLWKIQRHVGSVGLLSVLKTAERKLAERQSPYEHQVGGRWSDDEGQRALG